MKEEDKKLYLRAIDAWGESFQVDVAIEELAELINELVKYKRNRSNEYQVANEIADVLIMCEQLSLIFTYDKYIQEEKQRKLCRLEERLLGL